MPGATARLLLRDLRACAQFASATMRTFAPGTFESQCPPSLPLSVAPGCGCSGDCGVGSGGCPYDGLGGGGGGARRRSTRVGRGDARVRGAAPPATAADADATDLFRREGWEGSRPGQQGRLARRKAG